MIFANITRLCADVRANRALPTPTLATPRQHKDVPALRRVLTGVDRHSIEMREVTPMGGILTDEERQQALRNAV